ncbi:MAG: hypothetical protein J5486_03570 [Bacteroidaceae bacterium]|nr:hypothetical protein [Bacteroidaceae bacterium]
MTPIYVLISTIDAGILKVGQVLRQQAEAVYYVVSWQQTASPTDEAIQQAVIELEKRDDLTLTIIQGRGLSRNRNHAISTAISLLPSPTADAIMVIADDDERICDGAFEAIRELYSRYERLDMALLRGYSIDDNHPIKPYPPQLISYRSRPRSYYPSSWEMTFRSRIWHCGIRFDERFGLGAEHLCAGEEDIFLEDMMRKGLNAFIAPIDLCQTNPQTTGTQQLNPKVLRSKGATYGYCLNLPLAWLRAAREALSLGVRNKVNPFKLFHHLLQGIIYIRQ